MTEGLSVLFWRRGNPPAFEVAVKDDPAFVLEAVSLFLLLIFPVLKHPQKMLHTSPCLVDNGGSIYIPGYLRTHL